MRIEMKFCFKALGFYILSLPINTLAHTVGSAPSGEPVQVATIAISGAEHPCPKVKKAQRNSDGSISAICSNKEDYRIFTIDNKSIVMRCSVIRKLGVNGC
jgi:hypothetical protein